MIFQADLREYEEHTRQTLSERLNKCGDDVLNKILRRLVENGMAKVTPLVNGKRGRELLPSEIPGRKDISCTINFVGVIVEGDYVLRCYPKYISGKLRTEDLQQVLEVIERYYGEDPKRKSKRENPMEEVNDSSDEDSYSFLSLMRWIMLDYYENGVYNNTRDIMEINGEGEILWDKTINETVALINKGRPYYTDLITRKHVSDESDYCRRLHECILTEISEYLGNLDLLYLLKLTGVELTAARREDFGDTGYILYRIERELNTQFNTRKQMLLRNMYDYISRKDPLSDREGFMFLGVSRFDTIWENVCARIMENRLDTELGKLDDELGKQPSPLYSSCGDYGSMAEKAAARKRKEKGKLLLKDLIEQPKWSNLADEDQPDETKQEEQTDEEKKDGQAGGKLRLDLVTIREIDGRRRFIIFDAKYYDAYSLTEHIKPQRLPRVSDVTKQYFYQLAFQPFIRAYGLKPGNCFLMPAEEKYGEEEDGEGMDKVGFGGKVSMGMLGELLRQMLGKDLLDSLRIVKGDEMLEIDSGMKELEDIKVRFLPPHRAYKYYLDRKPFPLEELELDCDK